MIFEKKREYSKQRFRWRELHEEYLELKLIDDIAWREFYDASIEYIVAKKLDNPFESKKGEKKFGNKQIFEEEETKAIYRQVAIKTHPDKGGEEHVDVFRDIALAKKSGNLNKMLDGARKVNIKLEEISIKQIDVLEEEVNELEEKINKMNTSVHWVWYHANNVQRKIMLEQLLNPKYV